MKKLILFLLFSFTLCAADIPFYITTGDVKCGFIRRPLDKVQIWCWEGIVYTESTLIMNTIFKVTTETPFQLVSNKAVLMCSFTKVNETIEYIIVTNAPKPVKGVM